MGFGLRKLARARDPSFNVQPDCGFNLALLVIGNRIQFRPCSRFSSRGCLHGLFVGGMYESVEVVSVVFRSAGV